VVRSFEVAAEQMHRVLSGYVERNECLDWLRSSAIMTTFCGDTRHMAFSDRLQ